MSVKVISLVWDKYPGSGSELLCMLALADWCNDSGSSLYPSIAQIAAKMRVSSSQARRMLHKLMPQTEQDATDGRWFVRVVGNENGGPPGTTRHYQLNVVRLKSMPDLGSEDASIDPENQRDGLHGCEGSHGCEGTASTGASLTVIEPLLRERARASEDEDFERARRAWPSGFVDSREEALAAWERLTVDERAEAVREIDRFTKSTKAVGRTVICSLGRYLRDRKWMGLPPRPLPRSDTPSVTRPPPATKPTAFMLANPHLFPEKFGGGSPV